jgi:hypothetical protein
MAATLLGKDLVIAVPLRLKKGASALRRDEADTLGDAAAFNRPKQ